MFTGLLMICGLTVCEGWWWWYTLNCGEMTQSCVSMMKTGWIPLLLLKWIRVSYNLMPLTRAGWYDDVWVEFGFIIKLNHRSEAANPLRVAESLFLSGPHIHTAIDRQTDRHTSENNPKRAPVLGHRMRLTDWPLLQVWLIKFFESGESDKAPGFDQDD